MDNVLAPTPTPTPTPAMLAALQTAEARNDGSLLPIIGKSRNVTGAARDKLVKRLDAAGLIEFRMARPYISSAGRLALRQAGYATRPFTPPDARSIEGAPFEGPVNGVSADAAALGLSPFGLGDAPPDPFAMIEREIEARIARAAIVRRAKIVVAWSLILLGLAGFVGAFMLALG